MLANVSSNILLFLLILISVSFIGVIIGGSIWGILKGRKNNSSNIKTMIYITLLAIFIATVSWVLNMGWIRFIMTFLLMPFIHAIIFF